MGSMFTDFLSKTDPFGRHIPVQRFYGSTPPGLVTWLFYCTVLGQQAYLLIVECFCSYLPSAAHGVLDTSHMALLLYRPWTVGLLIDSRMLLFPSTISCSWCTGYQSHGSLIAPSQGSRLTYLLMMMVERFCSHLPSGDRGVLVTSHIALLLYRPWAVGLLIDSRALLFPSTIRCSWCTGYQSHGSFIVPSLDSGLTY